MLEKPAIEVEQCDFNCRHVKKNSDFPTEQIPSFKEIR